VVVVGHEAQSAGRPRVRRHPPTRIDEGGRRWHG
jgi:hypothetical protein